MKAKKFYGWNELAALWLQYFLNMGLPLYGGAVISSVMLSEGAITRNTHGLAFSLLNLSIGLASILIAGSITRWGVRITFMIGSGLIMLSSLILSFFAYEPWHFLLALGVLLGIGIGFGSVMPLSTAVARWFVRMRGKAMAVALTAPSVAGLVFAPTINWMIQNMGLSWRNAWLIIAGTMVFSVLIAFFLVKESPQSIGQEPDGGVAPKKQQAPVNALRTHYDWTPRQAYKTPAFWLIVVTACVTQFPFFFFTAHWIPAMTNFSFTPAAGALAMSVFTIMGLPARLIAGYFLDRSQPRYVFVAGFLCYSLAYVAALMITAQTLPLAFLAAVLMAFGFGLSFVSVQTVVAQYFGLKAFPKLNGNALLISAVVSCPAPVLAGYLFGIYGSYAPSFIMNIIAGVIGMVVVLFLKMPKPPAESDTVIEPAVTAKIS